MNTPTPMVVDQYEAEARFIYSVFVAGKSAKFADAVIRRLLAKAGSLSPFEYVAKLVKTNQTEAVLREIRSGSYGRHEKLFREIAQSPPNLATAMPPDLEKLCGVGRKTSRFFIMWVRPAERYAALDTHVLKWMRFLGHKAPKHTPQDNEEYAKLETAFIAEADARQVKPRILDAAIWDHCACSSDPNRPKAFDTTAENWPAYLQKEQTQFPQGIIDFFTPPPPSE